MMSAMQFPKWLPHPSSFISAAALKVFAWAYALSWAMALPILAELMETSPRLAWLGVFALWTSPLPVIAVAHRLTHGLLDLADGRESKKTRLVESVWAGLLGWTAFILVGLTAALAMLVIDPPPPAEPDSSSSLMRVGAELLEIASSWQVGVHSLLWFGFAVAVFQVHRSAREA